MDPLFDNEIFEESFDFGVVEDTALGGDGSGDLIDFTNEY